MTRPETPPDKTGPDSRDLKEWLAKEHAKIMKTIHDDYNASEFAWIGDFDFKGFSDKLSDAFSDCSVDVWERLKGEE